MNSFYSSKNRPCDLKNFDISLNKKNKYKVYEKPVLKKHGSIQGLTLGSSGAVNESPNMCIPGISCPT